MFQWTHSIWKTRWLHILSFVDPAQYPKVIEVLCSKKAFVVKKCAGGALPAEGSPTGQITWSRFSDVAAAWECAKKRACFDNTPWAYQAYHHLSKEGDVLGMR